MKHSLPNGNPDSQSDGMSMGECYDIAIVGSGISCAYTLIHYIALLEKQPPGKSIKVIVFEKSGEFWNGIPYGSRSGRYSLLISSLKEFLPQNEEREAFAAWLSKNRDWVFDRFKQGDGELATKWLRSNEKAMADGLWDHLFIPRYTFGLYLQERLTDLLQRAAARRLLECSMVSANVVDIERVNHLHRIHFVSAAAESAVLVNKVILGIGSPPNGVLEQPKEDGADESGCLIGDMYEPSVEFNIRRITEALKQSKGHQGQSKQVLIVGANASALEALYWLNNSRELHGLISKFSILSSKAAFPHRISREVTLANYSPKHLGALVKAGAHTAKQILDAIRQDVAHATAQNINVADLFGDISRGMIEALNQLEVVEQKKFVAKYGVEIGRLQRRAGSDYLEVVDALAAQGRLEMLKGRCVRCVPLGDSDLGCEFMTGKSGKEMILAGPFAVVISCAGFQDVTRSSSTLMRNLIGRKICVPNASKRGFRISESFETSKGCYLIGPLVAGNLAGKLRIWHAESCTRIIAMSRQLAAALMPKEIRSPRRLPVLIGHIMKVLGTADHDEWMDVLASTAQHDFYHLPQYHRVEEARGEGVAQLFAYREGDCVIALPLMLRPVDDAVPDGWKDATSVYGYGGAVASHQEVPEAVVRNFRAALKEALMERRVVAAFSRLHPLLPQSDLFAGLGECRLHGQAVSVDLTLPPEDQRARYRNAYKTRLNKLQREGVVCVHDATKRHLAEFISIYRETMRRVNANDSYFFGDDYFTRLAEELGDKLQLFVVRVSETVAAAGLFTLCDGIIQFHLGGTRDSFLGVSPMPLLIDTVRLWGNEMAARVLHLGGGVGSKNDTLWHFKAGFSDRRHDFATWRWIVVPEVYRGLCEERRRLDDFNNSEAVSAEFFPAYRCPAAPRLAVPSEVANT